MLVGLAVAGAAPAQAQQDQRAVQQVLVLQSADRGNVTLDRFTAEFRNALDRQAGIPVNVVQVVVGPTGSFAAPDAAILAFIRSKFADRPKPDLIMSVAGPAAQFAHRYQAQLFPGTPVLLAAVDHRVLEDMTLSEREAVVPVANDPRGMVDNILQLLPGTREIFVVLGSGSSGEFWRTQLMEEFKPFAGKVSFSWSTDLSFPEMLRRCAGLPPHSAIFYVTYGNDAVGAAYSDERVLADLHAAANAPLFGVQSPYLGAGVVGGPLVSIDELGQTVADVANRILRGDPPKDFRLKPQPPGRAVFDARELDRWGIPESRLPPGGMVQFRAPSLWREYRSTALAVLSVLVVQALLIVGLLYQRRARQRAELESRRSLALAADAGRRQTMAALTNSITHELGQPLSSMVNNAQALQMMISTNRAPEGTITEILTDIQAQGRQARQIIDRHRSMLRSREMSARPTDLGSVIRDGLALVSHDLKVRGIEAAVDLPAGPCVVHGDHVLLQQVIVNLVMNAMDAMADTPRPRRRVSIGVAVEAADVRLSVGDSGTGLPEKLDGKLFAPFVTTKAHGLGIGLTIVRTIVDAHGGGLSACNNPDGGATFIVTLRRSAAPTAPVADGAA
ncbi:MAG TPA: ATP-binding protein [Vicinamibacterales bacterium]|nr:ATP-binding protein [Vicinamibacterales bacterium]